LLLRSVTSSMSSLLNQSIQAVWNGYACHWPCLWLDSGDRKKCLAAHWLKVIGWTAHNASSPARTASMMAVRVSVDTLTAFVAGQRQVVVQLVQAGRDQLAVARTHSLRAATITPTTSLRCAEVISGQDFFSTPGK
jgi:hypothetical protein